MPTTLRRFLQAAGSIRLTIVLLSLSLVMIFAATLDQVHLGVWGVQQKYFHSFIVWGRIRGTTLNLPVFPGGYLLGGVLLVNLICSHVLRQRWSLRGAGLWLTHAGLILLLAGEGLSGLLQHDAQLRLNVGDTGRYAESFHEFELAIVSSADAGQDAVTVVPAGRLATGARIDPSGLPFAVQAAAYFADASALSGRGRAAADAARPAAYVQLLGRSGPIGTYLLSADAEGPVTVPVAGRDWRLQLRARRYYQPFSLRLLRFTHESYAGSDIPRNFASRVQVKSDDGRDDRVVDISMNRPFRFRGLAFYQAGYANNDHTSVLEVVRNPSWRLPYLSCGLIGLGLALQFGLRLLRFAAP